MGTPFPERRAFPRPLLNLCPASWADGHPFSRLRVRVRPSLLQTLPEAGPESLPDLHLLIGEPFTPGCQPISHGSELTPAPASPEMRGLWGIEGWPSSWWAQGHTPLPPSGLPRPEPGPRLPARLTLPVTLRRADGFPRLFLGWASHPVAPVQLGMAPFKPCAVIIDRILPTVSPSSPPQESGPFLVWFRAEDTEGVHQHFQFEVFCRACIFLVSRACRFRY